MRILGRVLTALSPEASNAQAGKAARRVVDPLGGPARLLEECDAALAAVSDNHLPLLWRFYRSHRKTLFRLVGALELGFMLDIATTIVESALRREESRGAHQRTDFPARDDTKFLAHSVARRGPHGECQLEYLPVAITRWPPAARVYGT